MATSHATPTGKATEPTAVISGHEVLLHELVALRRSEAALRDFIETSTIGLHWVGADDRGTRETYCMPHHLSIDGKNRRLMIAALRYMDTFVKTDGGWLFAARKLYVDRLEQRELS